MSERSRVDSMLPAPPSSGSAAAIARAVTEVPAFLIVPSIHGLARCCSVTGTAIHSSDFTVLFSDQRIVRSSIRPANVEAAPGAASTRPAPTSSAPGDATVAASMPPERRSDAVAATLMTDERSPAAAYRYPVSETMSSAEHSADTTTLYWYSTIVLQKMMPNVHTPMLAISDDFHQRPPSSPAPPPPPPLPPPLPPLPPPPLPPPAWRSSTRRIFAFGQSESKSRPTCTSAIAGAPSARTSGPAERPALIAPVDAPSWIGPSSRFASYAVSVACASADDCIISSVVSRSSAT